MTPGARVAAAAEILDRILAGEPAERALTNWARGSRFAGSGDRAAIRDLVFDAVRQRRSAGAGAGAGDAAGGRALMLGLIAARGDDPGRLFTGQGHSPAPLTEAERAALDTAPGRAELPEAVALDCPDWLAGPLREALGAEFGPVMEAMRHRAPVWLRVNLTHAARNEVADRLVADDIATTPHPEVPTALRVDAGAGRLRQSRAWTDGLVELQDASSQAAALFLPLRDGWKVLDYCAGGGGKSLALADRCRARFYAHDLEPRRMADLQERARRAGVRIETLPADALARHAPYDLVLCDVPCSGSGTWRRAPDAKWALTPDRLAILVERQRSILDAAARLVSPKGVLAYLTCSLLRAENEEQVDRFAAGTGWRRNAERRWSPCEGGDGFYAAILTRE